jgi:hypothetical protein
LADVWHVDLDADSQGAPPNPRTQAFTLWLHSSRLGEHRDMAVSLVRTVLREDPFTTLQIVLDPGDVGVEDVLQSDLLGLAEALLQTCLEQPTYLDKFYAMHPVRIAGAKRLVVLLPAGVVSELPVEFVDSVGEIATIASLDARHVLQKLNG